MTLTPGALLALVFAPGLESRTPPPVPAPAPSRVHCPEPRSLRLHRFEDRSAQLRCGGRVIARISVPG